MFILLLVAFQRQTETPLLRIVEEPSFRVEGFKSGNTKEGNQFFEAVLENITDNYVSGGVSFSAYLPDGTKHYGCYAPGGGDPGEYFTVAPREKVRVQCHRSIVPVNIQLKVTMRLYGVRTFKPLPPSSRVTIAEQGVRLIEKGFEYDDYEAWAMLESKRWDSKVSYEFRLYDKDGIQVGEYRDPVETLVEPEVKRRVTWSTLISRESKKPVSVKTIVRDAR